MKLLINKLLYIAIFAFPILFISVPRTTTTLATLLAFLCLVPIKNKIKNSFASFDIKLITIAYFSYLIAIIFTQLSLNKFVAYDFQQQGRLILLLPLFYYIYIEKIDMGRIATYSIPLACIFGAISSIYIFKGSVTDWGERHTVQHIDPLNFGYLMLFLGFSSLLIGLRWTHTSFHKILCLAAFFCGVYMSIKSGSRTGWLAIPLVALWFLFRLRVLTFYSIIIASLCVLAVTLIPYLTNYIFHARVDDFFKGFIFYSWNNNPDVNDTSIGARISMIRMGWHAFTQAPWFGFGSENIYHILNVEVIKNYATEATIKFASAGFMHNELLTQLVKHGIFGGLAYLFILYNIVRVCIKVTKLKITSPMTDVFVIYIIFAVIAGLSTEILIVKPMILFFGFMLACFAGEALWRIREKEAQVHASSTESI